jgi:hypothetical protein
MWEALRRGAAITNQNPAISVRAVAGRARAAMAGDERLHATLRR